MSQWLVPSSVAFLLWGVWAFLPKLTMQYINPKSAVVYEALGGLLVALAVLAFVGFRPETHARGMALALITGALGLLGAFGYLYAVSKGPVALISTMTALYPIITIMLAYLVLGEPITIKQGIGLILALVAIVLITS